MPKKVMENVYLYDKKAFVSPDKYNEPLFQDIDREMQTRTLDGQVDLMMDLALFQTALPDSDHNKDVINNYIVNFFMPLDANKNLRKSEFESRMEKLEERRMKRIYYPEGEFSLAQHEKHSDECIAQKIALSKPGLMDLGLFNALFKMYDQSEAIEKAYDIKDASDLLRDMSEETQTKILDSMSEEDRRIGREGLNYIRTLNGHEYTEEEKEVQKTLQEKDLASEALLDVDGNKEVQQNFERKGVRERYCCAKDTDLSFISDRNIYDSIQNSMTDVAKKYLGEYWGSRHKDTVMDEFAKKMSDLDKQLFDKKVNGTRLFDSSEFNTIKDDLKKLQKDMQKGNKTETLKNLRDSMETFSEHCQKYLNKNTGNRRERGNERKRIVREIQVALDKQIKALDKDLGEKFHEKDDEWVNVERVKKNNKVGIKLSYVDLAGKNNEPMNRISRPSNPAKENVKNGPGI